VPERSSSAVHDRATGLRQHVPVGRPSVVAAGIVAGIALCIVVALWWLLRTPPVPVEASLPMAEGATPSTSSGTSNPANASTVGPSPPGQSAATVVVQVAGAVRTPGVYRLASGARVVDVIDAAGGPTSDSDVQALALASVLRDGDRVWVPRAGEVPPGVVVGGSGVSPAASTSGNGASGLPSPTQPIDINRATVAELDGLSGIGPATATAIANYREQHGAFASVDELLEVRGIGPAKLDAIRASVRV
jgi:competence protein ComEA